jgi:hypothetical protein
VKARQVSPVNMALELLAEMCCRLITGIAEDVAAKV